MRPLLLTSWDDGSSTDVRLAKLLAQYGFRGTFFATARPSTTAPASDDELRTIVRLGHEIGNHGVSHRSLTTLADTEILDEAERGMARAQEFSPDAALLIAAPNGRIDGRVANVLAESGYRIRTAPIVRCRSPRSRIVEPTCQLYPHGRIETVLHLAKRHAVTTTKVGVAWLSSRTLFGRINRLVDAFSHGAEPLHIWGHSEEIEQLQYWGEVEQTFARAQQRGYVGMTLGAYLVESREQEERW